MCAELSKNRSKKRRFYRFRLITLGYQKSSVITGCPAKQEKRILVNLHHGDLDTKT